MIGHLAYCTLVHPGDTWEEMRASLETYAPAVKERVSPTSPYGVSLRLSGASAVSLAHRSHFHVPIFLDDLGAFRTTRAGIEDAPAVQAELALSDHLEIETYTWDVLQPALKTGDIVDHIVREWTWLSDRLG